MPLRTVRVPPDFEALFEKAEELVSSYFGNRREDPTKGRIEISGERYVLVRAASLSVEFFSLVRGLYGLEREDEADSFSRNILFDLAHAIGCSDARRFHEITPVDDPIERLAAGPVHFAHSGWAFVDIHPESRPSPDEDFYLLYDHPYSFEADAWLDNDHRATFPVCVMNAGYSSGWCEESFGVPLIASEVLCRGRGDESCRFVMAHKAHIEERVTRYIEHEPGFPRQAGDYEIPDFFARKRIEDELRRARDELEERVQKRTAELFEANENLRCEMQARSHAEARLRQKHKLEALGRLAGGIAHDFNNLMTVVLGNAGLLEGYAQGDENMQRSVLEIRQAGERAASITRQLLSFGRASLAQPELLELDAAVRETVGILERVIGGHMTLIVDLAAGSDCYVHVDRGQIAQVLLNLAVNARDAMPEGGRIELETRAITLTEGERSGVPAGDWAVLSVQDAGMGIDEDTLGQVFDPYFTTKEHGKGTGLGLSTVYGIVTEANGHITADSTPGSGSRFDVYLPLHAPPNGEPDPNGETYVPHGDETILIVEDEHAPRRLFVEILSGLGYDVLEAATPVEALKLARKSRRRIDLLLTDVVMPQMSGQELATRLRDEGHVTRVLFVTGYARGAPGKSLPQEHLLPKPFRPEALAQRVREVLDSR